MSAMQLDTDITMAFVESALAELGGPSSLRLLEVGCGPGLLAQALAARGHRVVAIDSSEEAIAATRARGVDGRVARFPAFEDDDPFDAVLFTRSLHHIPPLRAAVTRAHELLRPGGALILDDFAHDRVDRVTALWAFGYLKSLRALGLLHTEAFDDRSDPLATWRRKYTVEHTLHGGQDMLDALLLKFAVGPVQRSEYFYRYVCRDLDSHPRGREVAEAMRWAEVALVEEGVVQPIGLRLSARAR